MLLLLVSAFIKGFLVFGAAILLLFITYCAFYKSEMSNGEESAAQNTMPVETAAESTENSDIPSIYIDECVLPHNCAVLSKETAKQNKETVKEYKETVDKYKVPVNEYKETVKYKVNDSEFLEEFKQDDCLVQFEIHKKKAKKPKMEPDYDLYCSTPTDSESETEEDISEPLTVALQEVSHGVILNSTVYLTDHQWNTLVFIDLKTFRCFVCDFCSDLDTSIEHIATESHKSNLRDHPPLLMFDLSCTRKMDHNYHCAVCNELFDLADNIDHFASKMHEGNILFAINKASDILYDSNIHFKEKSETFNFKKPNMIVDDHIDDDDDDVYDAESVDYSHEFINFQNHYEDEIELPQSGISYAKMAKTPKVTAQQFIEVELSNKKVKVRFDSWHMVIFPESNRFYCMVCKIFDHVRLKVDHCSKSEHLRKLALCQVVEAYEEYFIRRVDDKLYHCGHCNNLQLIHEMIDHVEVNHPRKTKLIADSKHGKSPSPSKDSTKENRNTINENSTTKDNRNTNSENKDANNENRHTINENRNKINERNSNVSRNLFKDSKYLTGPSVKTDLSHNIGAIQKNHVQNSNNNANISRNTVNDIGQKKADVANNGAIQKTVQNTNNGNFDTKMADIFEFTTIYPFGYKLTIPVISYNVLCKRLNDFYCGICDVICPEEVISRHIFEIRHIEMLQRTPFIVPFSCHLIRAIREALHCAICNMPVPADKIYHHIREPQHMNFLTKALKINEPRPLHTPKIPFNIPGDVNINSGNTVNNAQQSTFINNNSDRVKKAFNKSTVVPKVPDVKVNLETHKNFMEPLKEIPIERFNLANENYVQKASEEKRSALVNLESLTMNEAVYEDNLDQTFDSVASEDASFDLEEHVYLKLRNTYIKIANSSYNTLVHIGDGSRYCFVCALQIEFVLLQRHVDSRGHLENMEKYRFLDKYEDHLLRQIYLMYHCSICNVILSRKELKTHLEWPTHVLQNENTLKNVKKQRKNEIKGGIKQIVVSTQKEDIYLNDKETKIKIGLNVIVTDNMEPKIKKKNKIIILHDNVFKVLWESWHGVSKIKNGYKCILCQREFCASEIETHCESEWHGYGLDKPFEKQYGTALIRKINESTLNCVVCNTEVSNKEHIIKEHVDDFVLQQIKRYEGLLRSEPE